MDKLLRNKTTLLVLKNLLNVLDGILLNSLKTVQDYKQNLPVLSSKMAASNKQRIWMVPRPVYLHGRANFFLEFFCFICFFENCYFYNKLVIGLRVVQFCLLSLLVILKTNWIRVPLRSTLIQICYLKSLVMITDRIGLHSVLLPLLIGMFYFIHTFYFSSPETFRSQLLA